MSARGLRGAIDDIEADRRVTSLRRGLSGSERSDIEVTPRARRSHSASASSREGSSLKGKERLRDRTPAKVPSSPRNWWQNGLLLTLFFCGPVGTLVSFILFLPSLDTAGSDAAAPTDGDGTSGIKMVHLQLSGTNRRARFVLDEYTVWGTFLAGVRDRLQCGHIKAITDSSGEAILAVTDMVDHDHIIIHADWSEVGAGGGSEERGERERRHAGKSGAGGQLRAGLGEGGAAAPPPNGSLAMGGGGEGGSGLETSRKKPRASVPQLLEQLSSLHEQDEAQHGAHVSNSVPAGGRAGAIPAGGEYDGPNPSGAGSDGLVGGVGAVVGETGAQTAAGAAAVPGAVNSPGGPKQPSGPCGERHPQFRIAMVVPWVDELPSWVSYFVLTARRSRYLIDWLIFHESLSPPNHLPDNVRFIDLGVGGLAQLFGLKMGVELNMPVRNASLLIRSMRYMFERWPRLVAEYKPAFGAIFEQYLTEYSHWGYCDLDMVIGNLPLFIEHSELASQDIVTYSFGDVDAIYLRGQWTMHRNVPEFAMLWKGCPHLGSELQKELLMKVAWVSCSFLFPFFSSLSSLLFLSFLSFAMLWKRCPHLGIELQKELWMKVAWVSCSFLFSFLSS
jgi:nitrite reductase/ring-hydroxylating ferredoxin subunit